MRSIYRGLKFTCQGLRSSLSNPSEELSVSFTTAYGNTLKQYHSFLVRPVFAVGSLLPPPLLVLSAKLTFAYFLRVPQLAMKACPYRKDFYAKLGSPQTTG